MAENAQSDSDKKKKQKRKIILNRFAGIFWSYLWSIVSNALHILPAILIAAAVIFFIYCLRTGTKFDDFIAFPEILDNAIGSFVETLEKAFPDIGLYLAPFITVAELVRAGIDTLENMRDDSRNSENSQARQASENSSGTAPSHLPSENSRGTHINAFFYTDNYRVEETTAVKNSYEVIDSLKISCTIINEHNRTEKVVFESSVYFPAINMVKYLHSESYSVMPCDTVNADNPFLVNITPALADEIYKEVISKQGYVSREIKCTVRIMTNRKLAYEEDFVWQKNR